MKKLILAISIVLIGTINFALFGAENFYEDFSSGTLNNQKWLIAEKAWGNNNGGVVADNVKIKFSDELNKNVLSLAGNGDLYQGDITGVDKYGRKIERKSRVGASIATKEYFASGTYEVRMKLPKNLGLCSALWTFHYEEGYEGTELYSILSEIGTLNKYDFIKAGLSIEETNALWQDLMNYKNEREPYLTPTSSFEGKISPYFRAKVWDITKLDLTNDFNKLEEIYIVLQNAQSLNKQGSAYMGYYKVRNHEIDIELPTALKNDLSNISYSNARFNSWIGEAGGEFTDNFVNIGAPLNDDKYHTYMFKWYTDEAVFGKKRVEFYVDNVLKQINYTHIPNIAGRFWIGIWFPEWTGTPNFSTDFLEIDWVKITPYNSSNDDYYTPESYPDFGWSNKYPNVIGTSVGSIIEPSQTESEPIIEEESVNIEELPANDKNENLTVNYEIVNNQLKLTALSSHGLKRINISDKNGNVVDEWLNATEYSISNKDVTGNVVLDITDYNGNIFHEEFLIKNNAALEEGIVETNESVKVASTVWELKNGRLQGKINSPHDLKRVQIIDANGKLIQDIWGNGKDLNFEISAEEDATYTIFISDYNGFGENFSIVTDTQSGSFKF